MSRDHPYASDADERLSVTSCVQHTFRLHAHTFTHGFAIHMTMCFCSQLFCVLRVYMCVGVRPSLSLAVLAEDFVADEKWKGWLFVFGTVIADEPKPDDPTKSLYYNAAPVLLGGSSERFLVTKQFISSIDFLSACAPSQQCTEKPKAEANAVIPEYAQKYLRDLGFQVGVYENTGRLS